jgi:uncharacterized membrane protein
MYELFDRVAAGLAFCLECVAVLLIAFGSLQALAELVRAIASRRDADQRRVFRTLARWLLLALEFTLAADVVHTAISPSWNDIAQLGAIAVIRTFLNYFLERDLEKARTESADAAPAGQSAP